jgi:hypothetical protein
MELSERDWTIKSLRTGNVWHSDKYNKDYQSYSAALDGIGEPVQINKQLPMRQEPKIGDTIYGYLTEETGKEGRIYYKFHPKTKQDFRNPQTSFVPTEKKEWQPRDDDAIRAQWAIGQAVQVYTAQISAKEADLSSADKIEENAKKFYAMVDRVKGSESLKAEAPTEGPSVEEELAAQQAKRDENMIKGKELVEDREFQSLLSTQMDDTINLDDIPF